MNKKTTSFMINVMSLQVEAQKKYYMNPKGQKKYHWRPKIETETIDNIPTVGLQIQAVGDSESCINDIFDAVSVGCPALK